MVLGLQERVSTLYSEDLESVFESLFSLET